MDNDTTQKLGPNQQKFVDALKSGEYEQVTQVLHIKDKGFCCLGVACKVFIGDPDSYVEDTITGHNYDYGLGVWDNERTQLPHELMEDLKFYSDEGDLCSESRFSSPMVTKDDVLLAIAKSGSLVAANDLGISFEKIAEYIEAVPKAVFTEEA